MCRAPTTTAQRSAPPPPSSAWPNRPPPPASRDRERDRRGARSRQDHAGDRRLPPRRLPAGGRPGALPRLRRRRAGNRRARRRGRAPSPRPPRARKRPTPTSGASSIPSASAPRTSPNTAACPRRHKEYRHGRTQRRPPRQPLPRRQAHQLPVKAGKTIYAGAIVELASGYAQPAASGNGKIYVGIADEAADNSATGAADGGKTVRVRRGVVVFMHVEASDAPAQADVGKDVYVADDHTVKKTKGSNTALGKLCRRRIVVGILRRGLLGADRLKEHKC